MQQHSYKCVNDMVVKMQKWYNGLLKGQRIIIAIIMFSVCSGIGLLMHRDIALIVGFAGLLPCIFFEIGRKK